MGDSANEAICVKGLASGMGHRSVNYTFRLIGDSANEAISMKGLTSQISVNKHSEMHCDSGQSPHF